MNNSERRMINPTEIIIDERQRKDLGDITELRESIRRVGRVIHPITITKGKKLVAGHRRLMSVLELEFDAVDIQYWEDLTLDDRFEIELEENIGRKDLTWDEEADSVAELQRRKKLKTTGSVDGPTLRGLGATNPNKDLERKQRWTLQDTADLIGATKSKVSLDIKLSGEMERNPSLRKLTKTQALAHLKREEMSRIRRELAKRAIGEALESVVHGDCRKVLPQLPSESIDLVLTDPPYGVDVHSILDGISEAMSKEKKFDDSADAWKVVLEIRDELHRVMVAGSHLYMFCASENFKEIRDWYAEKFSVRRQPIIWSKVYGGKVQAPDYQWGSAWEPILFASKGMRAFRKDGYLTPSRSDVIVEGRVPSMNKEHETQKPVRILRDLIKISSDPNEIVLDPFGGSGSTGVAAIEAGRHPLIIELLDSNVDLIKSSLADAIDRMRQEEEKKNDGDTSIESEGEAEGGQT